MIYFDTDGRTLKGYAFDHQGLRETVVDTLWRLLGNAAFWADAYQDECDWVHPLYRWVLDVDDDGN